MKNYLNSRVDELFSPTDSERHQLLEQLLTSAGRKEDLPYILEGYSHPEDIIKICPPGYGKGKNINVAVIGGGISGLVAAFELRKLGVDVTLYEASNRYGGRIYTHFFDKERKYAAELGAMRIPLAHECTWHYLNLFKIETRPFIQRTLNGFTYIKGVCLCDDIEEQESMKKIYPLFDLQDWEKKLHWGEMLNNAIVTPLLSLTPSERKDIVQIKKKYSYKYNTLCQYNLRQMLKKGYLSDGAVDLVCSFSPFLRPLQPYSYSEILHDEYPMHFSNLYQPVNNFISITEAFLDALKSDNHPSYGVKPEDLGTMTLKLSTPIEKIFWEEGDSQVSLSHKENNQLVHKKFDFVINTIPFSTLRNIDMSKLKSNILTQAITEVNYMDAVKVYILYKRRFWEDLGIIAGYSLSDLSNAHIYYPSDHYYSKTINPEEPGVLLAWYNLALEASNLTSLNDDEIIQFVNRNIEKIHGLSEGMLDKYVLDYKILQWSKMKWIGDAFAFFYPNQKRHFLYEMTQPEYDNKMFFAGEHVSFTHAWIQGGMRSSLEASNKIARLITKKF
ncbi:flavin monoamine oxidase family protein [Oceanirhabdus sp. W0125-5]|uniref:flavin monoamine oxidase family protein n=1 Tax=Oceanirhabdus sp. W0125-5 TaxID=2999116 RepID=UPI0022F3005C|nr:FAD-dependent oxidoreductase [Oceanirhabdus sp. W0125-5]WBW98081.1 FAD-dependent oxidoreductase [Oceanirhabdus sp. W0125-5]